MRRRAGAAAPAPHAADRRQSVADVRRSRSRRSTTSSGRKSCPRSRSAVGPRRRRRSARLRAANPIGAPRRTRSRRAAPYVLLLTRDAAQRRSRARSSRCARIGALGERAAARLPADARDAGIGARRRVHIVRVRPSAAEARMHARWRAMRDAVRAERGQRAATRRSLALAVLHKRALSSAVVARAVGRAAAGDARCRKTRRRRAAGAAARRSAGRADRRRRSAGVAGRRCGCRDPRSERRLLTALHRRSARSRPRAKRRSRRSPGCSGARGSRPWSSPNTATRCCTCAHASAPTGRAARRPDPRRATRGARRRSRAIRARLLLATDAAAEGLNLHHRCRLVVNLELPWNPMRLEQRIGRVDRIGQQRTVHAFHLIAAAPAKRGCSTRCAPASRRRRPTSARRIRSTTNERRRAARMEAADDDDADVNLRAEAIAEARRLATRARCFATAIARGAAQPRRRAPPGSRAPRRRGVQRRLRQSRSCLIWRVASRMRRAGRSNRASSRARLRRRAT